MESWKQVFKEYNQNLKESFFILLKSLRGLCTAFGMTMFFLFFLSQDVVTGEWYIAARVNDLIANLGGGFKGELGALCIFIFMIGLGKIMDDVMHDKLFKKEE